MGYGLGIAKHDAEGRAVTLEYADFFLTTVYTPNSQNELKRLPYRQEWNTAFLERMKELESQKPVVFCGDLNVAHTEEDLANPKTNRKNAGFSDEERADFDTIIGAGFVDTFREFKQGKGHYSWWSYRNRSWPGSDRGRSLDHVWVTPPLENALSGASVFRDARSWEKPSDHAPVIVDMNTE